MCVSVVMYSTYDRRLADHECVVCLLIVDLRVCLTSFLTEQMLSLRAFRECLDMDSQRLCVRLHQKHARTWVEVAKLEKLQVRSQQRGRTQRALLVMHTCTRTHTHTRMRILYARVQPKLIARYRRMLMIFFSICCAGGG